MDFQSKLSTRVPLFAPSYDICSQPRLGYVRGTYPVKPKTKALVKRRAMFATKIRYEPLLNRQHLLPNPCQVQSRNNKAISDHHIYNKPYHLRHFIATGYKFNVKDFAYDPFNPTTPIRGRPLGRPDTILMCEGTRFNVHCGILSAHSKKFKTMFDDIMFEAQFQFTIDDISSITLALLIRHMYTGLVPLKIEVELLAAAHLYRNGNLKEVCETDLCHYVRADSAEKMLKDARTYEASRLEKHIIGFMERAKMWGNESIF